MTEFYPNEIVHFDGRRQNLLRSLTRNHETTARAKAGGSCLSRVGFFSRQYSKLAISRKWRGIHPPRSTGSRDAGVSSAAGRL
jgi:hypothetical protein